MFETTRSLALTDESKNLNNSDNIELFSDGSVLLKKANQIDSSNISHANTFVSKLKLNQDDVNLSAIDKIDYGPIHRCCQIFNVLVFF